MENVAYHEAGHALMATVMGAKVRSVTIEPDDDDGPQRQGDTQVIWRRKRSSEQEFRERCIRVLLAGPVAEMLYTGDTFHPGLVAGWAGDWNEAWTQSELLHPHPEKRMAYLEGITVQLYRLLNSEPYWSALAALADHLLAHETLESEDVHDLLDECLPYN